MWDFIFSPLLSLLIIEDWLVIVDWTFLRCFKSFLHNYSIEWIERNYFRSWFFRCLFYLNIMGCDSFKINCAGNFIFNTVLKNAFYQLRLYYFQCFPDNYYLVPDITGLILFNKIQPYSCLYRVRQKCRELFYHFIDSRWLIPLMVAIEDLKPFSWWSFMPADFNFSGFI